MNYAHGGGRGGGRGGRGGGRGGRGGRGHGGGDDDEAHRALIRSWAARKRGARRFLVQGARVPPSLVDYAPGGRFFELPPQGRGAGGHAAPAVGVIGAPPPAAAVQIQEHLFAHDDEEEVAAIAQAVAESEASIAAWRRREDDEIAAQMAVHRAREDRERAAKRARLDGAGPSNAFVSDDEAE